MLPHLSPLPPPFRGAWELLHSLLPLWKRPAKDGDSDQPDHNSTTILLASSMAPHSFSSAFLPEAGKKVHTIAISGTFSSELFLWAQPTEEVGSRGSPAQHVLLVQLRDEPLVPPPAEPPPPTLQVRKDKIIISWSSTAHLFTYTDFFPTTFPSSTTLPLFLPSTPSPLFLPSPKAPFYLGLRHRRCRAGDPPPPPTPPPVEPQFVRVMMPLQSADRLA